MAGFLKFAVFTLIATACTVAAKPDKTVCYYGSWAVWRAGKGSFAVSDIDPFKCTHLIYTFVGITAEGGIRLNDPWLDGEAMPAFARLKRRNPSLKTLLPIGGWNEGSATFSRVAAAPRLRTALAQNALALMRQYDFDGFDVDWEYPARRDSTNPDDKVNLPLLLQELRRVFDATGRRYLLTAAVAAAEWAVDESYNVRDFHAPLDFVNVMAYDFHGAFDGRTGFNSPMTSADGLDVESSIQAWISRGVDPGKLVLGMPVYGRSFTVYGSTAELGETATPGDVGIFTGESGMLGYNEICYYKNQGGWTDTWDDTSKTRYMSKRTQWVSYDDEASITLKAQYAVRHNLGGAMVWSIDTDDIHGLCKSKKFPIISAINQVFFGSDNAGTDNGILPPEEPTQAPSQPTMPTSEPADSDDDDDDNSDVGDNEACRNKGNGLFRDPKDCTTFYYCSKNAVGSTFRCDDGTVFNEKLSICDWPSNVPEC